VHRGPLRGAGACAAVLLALAACSDEFVTDPIEGREARLEAVEWPDDAILLGETVTLRVRAIDEASGAEIQPEGIDWEVLPGFATELVHAAGDSIVLHVVSLVPLRISASLEHGAFDTAAVADTLPVHLNGIAVSSLSGGPLPSLGDVATVEAHGFDAAGAAVNVGGWSWSVRGTAVTIPATPGDTIRATAAANGRAWIIATHPLCTGSCRDSVAVDVAQLPASIDLPAELVLTSLGATATLAPQVRDALGSLIPDAAVTLSQLTGVSFVLLSGSTITTIAPGEALIAATIGPLADTITVRVSQTPASLTLSVDSVHFATTGHRQDVSVAVRDALGNVIPEVDGLVWETTAPSVVTVDPDSDPQIATLRAQGPGSAVVRVRLGALTDELVVTVD